MAFFRRDITSKVALVGIAGGLAANTFLALRGKRDRGLLLVERTLISGGVGLTLGLSAGFAVRLRGGLRGVTVVSSSITGSILGSLTGLTFFSVRETLAQEKFAKIFPSNVRQKEYYLSAFSGGACGLILGTITRSGITWAFSVAAVGCLVAGLMHLARNGIQKLRYRLAVYKYYPQYAERLLLEEEARLAEYDKTSESPGLILVPYRAVRDVLVDVNDRICGRTGTSELQKRILQRKLQIELLEAEETKAAQELEHVQRTHH